MEVMRNRPDFMLILVNGHPIGTIEVFPFLSFQAKGVGCLQKVDVADAAVEENLSTTKVIANFAARVLYLRMTNRSRYS